MSLSALSKAIETSAHELLSTDLFDTVLLRDHSTENYRLAIACQRAASHLGVDPAALTRLRWSFHDHAYQAVAMERPGGDAALSAICRTIATALGRGDSAARTLHMTEVDVDIEHLRANRPLLEVFGQASASGIRLIAVSDTYYSGADLERILDAVVGASPISAVYSSADFGLTKHSGGLFAEVARQETTPPSRILHVGDNHYVDVQMARAASWSAVHLPRNRRHRASKIIGKSLSMPIWMQRSR